MNNNSESYEFTSANKLFVDDELRVRDCIFQFFGEEVQKLVSVQVLEVLQRLFM
jgi:hypothetical protein